MQRLRRKARDTLSKGYLDGRLHSALCSLPEEHEADVLLQTSRDPGTAPVQQQLGSCETPGASGHPVNAAQQHTGAEAALSSAQRLRQKARDALSKGYLDGRLQSALHDFADESAADTLLPSSQTPGVPSAPTVSPAQQRRAEADAMLPSSAEAAVAPAATASPALQQTAEAALSLSPVQRLRRKARDALSKGYLDGGLQSALHDFADESAADTLLPSSQTPGVPPAPTVSPAQQRRAEADAMPPSPAEAAVAPAATASPALQHTGAEAALSSAQRLRQKARDALSKGYLDGRLQSALHDFADESAADTLLPSSQTPGLPPAPTASPAQQRRAEADAMPPSSAEAGVAPAATASPAQQHTAQAALSPAQRMPPSLAEAGVAPAAAVSPVPQHSPQADVSAEAAVAQAAAVSPEVLPASLPSPAVTPSPSPEQALQSGQVAPFSALPAASAWVLTDAEGDNAQIETPRLSRFAPSTFRRKPSAHSESSVVSEDLVDFMPDRSSWLLNENKDLQPSVVQASMASRWSHRSLAAEKQALQAMLAEFTPRISDFIPSKELPSLQSELLHLRPDERLPSTNDFTLEVADPDLQAFVPLPYDPGRSGVLTNRPPRELLWSEGSLDGVATPRLTQFMPCYPGVRS
ncbi:unnamed protein product [Symbiodinium sp. CCMP2592]|nr:unnamed protein product [Symbiodinium sp. CCMP2592]